jgi:ubiquitin carboxyl-terminal hydrolase 35/38
MDKLEEEDKSLLQDGTERLPETTNIVEEYFKGVLCVTYKCMGCGNESKHKEDFTDILLAFPEVSSDETDKAKTKTIITQEENPKSLKGGDQVRNFQETRYKEGSLEKSKESVSSVQTTPKAPTKAKPDVGQRGTFTIQEMLDYFMKPEELSGNNQYFCDQCRTNVDGERRVQIAKLPNFLMLSLKRFSFDVTSQTKPKLLHIVDYPEELHFCNLGESFVLGQKSSCADDDVVMNDEEYGQAMDTSCALHSYKLCSVVVHSGNTCEAGHYYSYALDTSVAAAAKPQWHCFNDQNTHETSYNDFLEREKSSITDTTYIVIYMNDKLEVDQSSELSTAPAEMVERVKQDNLKFLQVKY